MGLSQRLNKQNLGKTEISRQSPGSSQYAKLRLHIQEMPPICKTRKKTSTDREDDGFSKQFSKEGWPDDYDSTWLSSASASPSSIYIKQSPSSCFDDYKLDCKLSGFLDLSLQGNLSSSFSESENSEHFLSRAITLFDGSRVSPIEEASMVLDRFPSGDETILQEEFSDFSTFLESAEDSSTWDDSSTSFSTSFDSPFWAREIDRMNFSISLLNLDGEDSNWISDKQSEADLIKSGFPSPSYGSSWGYEIQSSCSSVSSVDEKSEAFDLGDLSPDKTLFWPLDENSDWGSDFTWDLFIMSPRKNNHNLLRVHSRKMDIEEGCRRRLFFRSGSKSSNILEFKCTSGNKEVMRSNTMPSRLSENTKNSTKIATLDVKVDTAEVNKNGLVKKPVGMFEEDSARNMELPIETLLGLDEFDGHEGVESEFNKDEFSLNESLRE